MSTRKNLKNILYFFNNGLITNLQVKKELGLEIEKDEDEFYKIKPGTLLYDDNSGLLINPHTKEVWYKRESVSY